MAKKVHPNNPAQRNPPFAQQVFDASSQPAAWLHAGRNLRSSATAIFDREKPIANKTWDELERIGRLQAAGKPAEEFDSTKFPLPNFDGAYMLMAFAIENFLKGLMVAKGIAKFSGLKLPKILDTHDLSKLHGLAKPAANISTHLLDSLTYMSEWRGRYPLPISVDRFWPMHPGGAMKTPGFSWPNSYDGILKYVSDIEGELSAIA